MRAGVLLVALVVLLAGCSGVTAPDTDATPTVSGGANGAGGSGGGSGGDSGNGTPDAAEEWARFTFSEGEFYRYAVTDNANDRTGEVTWTVLSVEDGEVTAEFSYTGENTSITRTVTGDKSTIAFELVQVTNAGADADEIEAAALAATYLSLGPFNPTTAVFTGRDLAVGNSWNLAGSPSAGYATANIEGRDSYAGLDCSVATIRVPDDEEWADSTFSDFESCITPDVALALYTAYYERGNDEPLFEVRLVEHRRG